MICLDCDDLFDTWREQARWLLSHQIDPAQVSWSTTVDLFATDEEVPATQGPFQARIPLALITLLQTAARYRGEQRWSLLYEVLWRVSHGDRTAMLAGDQLGSELHRRIKQVSRESHHLHAFLRFIELPSSAVADASAQSGREPCTCAEDSVQGPLASSRASFAPTVEGGPQAYANAEDCAPASSRASFAPTVEAYTCGSKACPRRGPHALQAAMDNAVGPEYVAWHEPAHDILASASEHFIGRMGQKRWLIATPQDGVYYDGKNLLHERQCPAQWREMAQRAEDPQGQLWLTYYSHIFNPARLNPKVMQGHLPTRFWKNLPEGALIPGLISEARTGKQRDGQARAIGARQGKRIGRD